ncbi:MAG: hypothetical protein Q9173_000083 [Seirophora scorigena]
MSDNSKLPAPEEQQNTGYIPGNDFQTRWGNNFRHLSGQMTQEGKRQMKIARDDREEEADCARCEKQRDYLLTYSPIIRFMRQNINKLGGDVNSENIRCRRCTRLQKAGFDQNYGIMLCANMVRDQGQLEDVLAHGLREKKSDTVGSSTTRVQGPSPSFQHRQRGLGQLFSGHKAFRRDLPLISLTNKKRQVKKVSPWGASQGSNATVFWTGTR